jgi:asparagine synthase (glutamine-hydrolysing)
VAHPFRDPRLIRFALGLPPSVRCDPLRRKPQLEEATRGILPEPIRTRREKRGFDDVYGRGLARNLGSLERLVEASPAHELGILDKAELVRAMRQASMGMGGVEARERIDKTLALVAWLDQVAS